MFKIILLFLIFLNLNSCGYSPVYKLNENSNFRITNINLEGERIVNNYLKSKFARYQSLSKGEVFELNVNSSFIKKPLTKDTTGKVTIYQLELYVVIKVKSVNLDNLENFKEFNKQFSFKEDFLLKNDSDKFEEQKYENSIKQNLTNTIFDKFILALTNR
jgi:hypothetical protein